MHGNKYIQLVKTFTKKEIKNLEAFISSPYHNKNQLIVALWEHIKPSVSQNFQSTDIEKHHLFKKMFPKKKKFASSLSVLFSQFGKLVEAFLIQEQFQQKTIEQQQFLLTALLEKEQFKYFEQRFFSFRKQFENRPMSTVYFYENFQLERTYSQYLQETRSKQGFNLQTTASYFEQYYILNKIRLAWEMMSLSKVYKKEFDYPFLEEIIQFTEHPKFAKNPLFQLYRQAIYLLQNPNDTDIFDVYIDLLTSFSEKIISAEKYELYTLAANYCIRKIQNEPAFKLQLLNIYKAMMQQDILTITPYLPENKFKNIVSIGCHVGDWDWTKTFIEHYTERIVEKNRKKVNNFGFGAYYYYKGEYYTALTFLGEDTNVNVFFDIDTKVLLLKCFYDLNYFEAFYNFALTLRKFIETNKSTSNSFKKKYKNFINLSLKLTRIKERQSTNKLKELRQKIEMTETISDKSWLIHKIEELDE